MDEADEKSNKKKIERLELRPDSLTRQLTVITRPKPKITKMERSSVLNKVKAFLPTAQKAETDLWKEMKINGEESVNMESVDDDNFIEMDCQVVPNELICSSTDESSSDESDDMTADERRIFDLINLKLGGAKGSDVSSESGVSSLIQPMDED
jgi:hypothetical protein